MDELTVWWTNLAAQDLDGMRPKIKEYSAHDLVILGQFMASMLRMPEMQPALYAELGCMFYLLGKLARALGAYQDNAWPSDDTLKDIEIYTKMIRRIRAVGGWPNA